MRTYTVYYHTFPNGKMYFGQTCQDVERRWRNKGEGYKNQKLLYRAIQKYGWDNIDHRIISIGLDKDEADFQEMFYISAYRTNEPEFGYNITSGGEGHSGSRIFSDEHRRKLSESAKGKKLSDETKNKISESLKGHKVWNKGKKFSEESRKKMSEAKKGRISPMAGRHHSEETKKKMSESRKCKNKTKYKFISESGKIIEMSVGMKNRWHPDWILLK